MFDSSPISSDRNYPEQPLNQVRDNLASLTHRMGELQSMLGRKMDRSECLSICEKKCSGSQLRRSLEEMQVKLREERTEELQRTTKMQQIAIDKINELGKKFRAVKHVKGEHKNKEKQPLKRVIQPQQLYLQSNQTMFSLLIQQISKLQTKDDQLQRQLQLKNKKVIMLNNEVCNKLQKLQAEIQQKVKFSGTLSESKMAGYTWSHMQNTQKSTVHRGCQPGNGQFETFRLEMLHRNIETLQKELLNKMNIRDVLPLIKQNCQPIQDTLGEVRDFVEESVESTKRILSSQTEINREISLGVKLGWWHSYEREHQFAILNKELVNLVPELIQWAQGGKSNCLRVRQKGLYLIRINPIQNGNASFINSQQQQQLQQGFQVMIGTDVHLLGRESAMRLDKNSQIRLILRNSREVLLCLQKL